MQLSSKKVLLFFVFSTFSYIAMAQAGKDGDATIWSLDSIVNNYTYLTADANLGSNFITVDDNALDAGLSNPLAQGDLIFIYQAQGANILGVANGNLGLPNNFTWGEITAYNNAGNFEFAEVLSTSGTNIINISCSLTKNYSVNGNTQIVRVPRFNKLTIQNAASITGVPWDGEKGGAVIIEVKDTTIINGEITATGLGFRGGALDPTSTFSPDWTTNMPDAGAEKGEGIAGSVLAYDTLGGRYNRACAANGGGGANAHNCGGGGGANAQPSSPTWSGFGCVDATYNVAWILEAGWLANHCSAGGGKGGYSMSSSLQDATIIGPSNSAWGGDWRRPYGGQGARVLDYSTGKLFFGGGGGAGDQNNGDGGAGGNGGGLIYLRTYGSVQGSGSIIANGDEGGDTDPSNPPFGGMAGNDGAGGAGGGGAVVINTNDTISPSIVITVNGGKGGNQLMAAGTFGAVDEAQGPGGGGGGGYIGISHGIPIRFSTGGANGTTDSPHLTEFPPNGATAGGAGIDDGIIDNWFPVANDLLICNNDSAIMNGQIIGNPPSGLVMGWYDASVGGNLLDTGTIFNAGILANDSVFYLGLCPGYYRIPVLVQLDTQLVHNEPPMIACDSAQINGNWYSTSQTVSDIFVGGAPNGCDSVVVTDLTINYSVIANVTPVISCDSAEINGNWYTSSQTVSDLFPGAAANGCDSTAVTDLTIQPDTYSSINENAIDSFITPSGAILYTSGLYQDTITNSQGCDSVITINLTVNYAGINEQEGSGIYVYPNPADQFIQIIGLNKLVNESSFRITNVSGQIITQGSPINEQIPVGFLRPGVYFLKIIQDGNTQIIRFVKQ